MADRIVKHDNSYRAHGARLEFRIKLIAYDGHNGWVEGALAAIHDTLRAPEPPVVNGDCKYCRYAASLAGAAHSAR